MVFPLFLPSTSAFSKKKIKAVWKDNMTSMVLIFKLKCLKRIFNYIMKKKDSKQKPLENKDK